MAKQALAFSVLALSALIALAGCTRSDVAATVDLISAVSPIWHVDGNLVGEPTVKNDIVASYVSDRAGELEIAVWNSRTGTLLWRDQAVTGQQTRGIEVSANIVDVGGTLFVPYLRDLPGDENEWQETVVADAVTGVPITLDNSAVWNTDRPSECVDAQEICFAGILTTDNERKVRSYRIDVPNGTVVPETDATIPGNARFLGPRIFSTHGRSPEGTEILGYITGGAVLWQRPYEEVFGSGYSSDGGWSWVHTDETGPLIGSGASYDPRTTDSDEFSYDYTEQRTVALDRETGALAWKIDAASDCIASVIDEEHVKDILPTCRWNSGTVSVSLGADGIDHDPDFDNLDMDLIGVERETGKIVWSLPLGGDESVISRGDSSFYSRMALRPVSITSVVTLVDALTGESTLAPVGGIYACATDRDRFTADFPGDDSAELLRYDDGQDIYPCGVDRKALDVNRFSPGGIRMAGHAAGDGYYVVGGASGLSGFLLPAAD